MRAIYGKSIGPSPCVRARLPVAVVWVLAPGESGVATKRKTIGASLGLDCSCHVQLLSWCAFQKALDGVCLRRGDDRRTGQGRVCDVGWNFLTVFALAALSVEALGAIASATSLVAAVTELSAVVKFSFHIPGFNINLTLYQTKNHLLQVRLLHFSQAHRSLNPTFT